MFTGLFEAFLRGSFFVEPLQPTEIDEHRVADDATGGRLEVAMRLEVKTQSGVGALVGRNGFEHAGGVVEQGLVDHVSPPDTRNWAKGETLFPQKSGLRLFRPLAVVLEFEGARLQLDASDGGVGAEVLEGCTVKFPCERGARFRVGGDVFLEHKGEFDGGVADLFIKRFAQEAQKGG